MDITRENKIQIVKNELAIYENTRYLLEVRHRVNKKLGNAEAVKQAEDELVKVEQAVDELKIVLKEISEQKG